ncbi:MAG: MoaD/ThiS family protein [Candidatus Diapherotrites archaeon]|nr:MoaD/ThiS family protein [Candidatus Diapherotrites archaeon]
MKVKAKYKRETKNFELKNKASVKELLKEMKVNPETVLVIRKNTVLPEDELLKDKDEVELLLVVSGG